MIFFSGFMFRNEEKCFKEFLKESEFTVAGFSLGAILAFEYVLANPNKRIDTLQLFSPAFFQNHKKSFIRTQLLYFKKDREAYKKNFLKNVFYPKPIPEFWKKEFENLNGNIQELEKLLNFKWNVEDLQKIINRNIQIEVFLGEQDKIINPLEAKNFFRKFADVFYIKQVGHILQNYDKI